MVYTIRTPSYYNLSLTLLRSFLGQSFFVGIIYGLIAVLLPSKIKRKEGIAAQVEGNNVKPAKKKRSVDFPGLLLFAAMLIGFLLTLDLAGRGVPIRDTVMMFSLVLLVTSCIAFFMTETYLVEKPLIPYSLLKNNGFGVQLLVQILLLNSQFSVRKIVLCIQKLLTVWIDSFEPGNLFRENRKCIELSSSTAYRTCCSW